MELCQPWVQKLLLSAGSLKALSTHIHTIPRSSILQHLPLRHLEVAVSSRTFYWLEELFTDVSRSLTLESLRISCNAAEETSRHYFCDGTSMRLPTMHLLSMPSLKHVRLDNCFPGHELALPAGCALFLDVLDVNGVMWEALWQKLQNHTTVLQLYYFDFTQWPHRLESFSNLQYLGLDMNVLWVPDLADLQHIPHVRIVPAPGKHLQLTAGSWQTLEIFDLGQLRIHISDVDSFVRDTRDFTFMSAESPYGSHVVIKQVQDACLRHGKACYMCKHHAVWHACRTHASYDDGECGDQSAAQGERFTYVILSTNKQAAEDSPVVCKYNRCPDASFGSGKPLAFREDFWPCDPCGCVKRACA